jgi:hypothetical protein
MPDSLKSDAHHSLMTNDVLGVAIEDGAQECFHPTEFGERLLIESV